MAAALKKVEGDPKCGFMIRSHDEKEIVKIAIEHAKKSHNMKITEKEVRDMMENAWLQRNQIWGSLGLVLLPPFFFQWVCGESLQGSRPERPKNLRTAWEAPQKKWDVSLFSI